MTSTRGGRSKAFDRLGIDALATGSIAVPDHSNDANVPNVQEIDAHASTFMKQGIRLMEEGGAGSAEEALTCFDRALELRRALPFEDRPQLRYGLAACWLNRAEALMRLNQLQPALDSYDAGIALMRALNLGDDPRYPRRLAIGLQNRGLTALSLSGRRQEAADAFQEAISVLELPESSAIPDRVYVSAAIWTNLAHSLAAVEDAQVKGEARDAALKAIGLVAGLEESDPNAAEVGLKARHALCQTLASRLAAVVVSPSEMPEDVHEATDAADEGLALVRGWEKRGVSRFRMLAFDLFRFGARVYGMYQPHFLEEFLSDNLDPVQSSVAYTESPEILAAAREAAQLARMASAKQ